MLAVDAGEALFQDPKLAICKILRRTARMRATTGSLPAFANCREFLTRWCGQLGGVLTPTLYWWGQSKVIVELLGATRTDNRNWPNLVEAPPGTTLVMEVA